MTVWVSGYSNQVGDEAATLFVVSTPDEEAAGRSVNPLGHLSPREPVDRTLDRLADAQAVGGIPDIHDVREAGVTERTSSASGPRW